MFSVRLTQTTLILFQPDAASLDAISDQHQLDKMMEASEKEKG
jgi:hypothetical protein